MQSIDDSFCRLIRHRGGPGPQNNLLSVHVVQAQQSEAAIVSIVFSELAFNREEQDWCRYKAEEQMPQERKKTSELWNLSHSLDFDDCTASFSHPCIRIFIFVTSTKNVPEGNLQQEITAYDSKDP